EHGEPPLLRRRAGPHARGVLVALGLALRVPAAIDEEDLEAVRGDEEGERGLHPPLLDDPLEEPAESEADAAADESVDERAAERDVVRLPLLGVRRLADDRDVQ